MIEEKYYECADCGVGVSEYNDIYSFETGKHYCKGCAAEIGLYKCHWCGEVWDVLENKSTCPVCGRELI